MRLLESWEKNTVLGDCMEKKFDVHYRSKVVGW